MTNDLYGYLNQEPHLGSWRTFQQKSPHLSSRWNLNYRRLDTESDEAAFFCDIRLT